MARLLPACIATALLLATVLLPAGAADDANTLYQQALDLYYREKYEDALAACEKSLALNPKGNNAWNLKGLILDNLGRYEEALAAFDRAIELKPANHIAYNNRGLTLKHMVRYEEALAAFDQSLKINPSYTFAYYNKGNLLSQMGRFDDAIRSFESALSFDPHYAQAWYSLGLVYQKKNLHGDAVASFERAIQENPGYKDAWYAKGISLGKLGKTEEALAALGKVLELDPAHASAKNQIAQIQRGETPSESGTGDILSPAGPDALAIALVLLLVAGGGAAAWYLLRRPSLPPCLPGEKPSLREGKPSFPGGKPAVAPAAASREMAEEMAPPAAPAAQPQKTRPHDVFISYSSQDKPVADAVCAHLESRKIRCWIAPRDLLPGIMYQEGIIDAIERARFMVFIFSSHSNNSPHVIRELSKAVSSGLIIIPFRIEDVVPSKPMEYLIGAPHWLDALTPPLEAHIQRLGDTIESLLSPAGKGTAEDRTG